MLIKNYILAPIDTPIEIGSTVAIMTGLYEPRLAKTTDYVPNTDRYKLVDQNNVIYYRYTTELRAVILDLTPEVSNDIIFETNGLVTTTVKIPGQVPQKQSFTKELYDWLYKVQEFKKSLNILQRTDFNNIISTWKSLLKP